MTQLHRATAVLLALVVTASACGTSETKDASPTLRDQIEVSGAFGETPTIKIADPLEVAESTSWTLEPGDGAKVAADSTTILHLTLSDARTGKTAISTHDEGQRPLEVKLGEGLFPSLAKALLGKQADSRVVVASTSDDAYGEGGAPQIGIEGGDPVVMVVDILSTDPTTVLDGPDGAAVPAPATAPKLVERGGVPVGFDFAGRAKPKKLVVVPLRAGTGPEITSPARVAVDYFGAVWGGKKPFDETYTKEPATVSIGLSSVIKAWDQGLAGQRAGARVMLICPPDLAYGPDAQGDIPANSTLVFVVDVLGVG